jgi:DNA polymerase-3 subunit delta'
MVRALQRALRGERLAHAYLVSGDSMRPMELFARTLAKALNCLGAGEQGAGGVRLDSCDRCASCVKIDHGNHPDLFWIRSESKSRQIRVKQMEGFLEELHLKPNEARWKVGVIVEAECLNEESANKFLKTLEEPPAATMLLLLTRTPERVLETLQSRCQRIVLAGPERPPLDDAEEPWLEAFAAAAAANAGGLLDRYRLLSVLTGRLEGIRDEVRERLQKASPLETAVDLDPEIAERLEKELAAAVEGEYRRRRGEILSTLNWWLHDIWLGTLQLEQSMLQLPRLAAPTTIIARRLKPEEAMANLQEIERTQRLLNATNVQEALALEVGLLKLRL